MRILNPLKIKDVFVLLSSIPKYVKLLWGLTKDRRVPAYLKLLTFGALSYLFAPLDMHPDFIPLWGMVDDIVVVLLVIERFISACPRDVVDEHLLRIKTNLSDFDQDIKRAKEVAANIYFKIKDRLFEFLSTYMNKK